MDTRGCLGLGPCSRLHVYMVDCGSSSRFVWTKQHASYIYMVADFSVPSGAAASVAFIRYGDVRGVVRRVGPPDECSCHLMWGGSKRH